MSHLFDIACNFSSERFDNDLQDVIQRAINNKVKKFLIVSASFKDVERVYEIYQQNNKNCFFTIGTHPHHANEFGFSSSKLMTDLVNKFHPHSIGETGLDFYRNISSYEACSAGRSLLLKFISGRLLRR